MNNLLKWLFVDSSARWLFYILTAEYFIAANLSPTILTDYPILNSLVESMAFIPAVHNFDSIAAHPEAVRFYIVLAIFLVIPKSFAVYDWLTKNPNMWLKELLITPLTTVSPATSQLTTRLSKTEDEIAKLPTVKRSMPSRIFWSVMILLFTVGMFGVLFTKGYGTQSSFIAAKDNLIAAGDVFMWFELSLKGTTFDSLLLAISTIVVRDYFLYFKTLFSR